jgi:hypothetical protein
MRYIAVSAFYTAINILTYNLSYIVIRKSYAMLQAAYYKLLPKRYPLSYVSISELCVTL